MPHSQIARTVVSRSTMIALALGLMVALLAAPAAAQTGLGVLSYTKGGGQTEEAAASILWVEAASPQIIDKSKSINDVERGLFLKTQIDLITSNYVIDLALQQPGLPRVQLESGDKSMRSWLKRHLVVTTNISSQIMYVGLDVDKPEQRPVHAAFARAVTTAYLQVHHDQLATQRQQESQQLNQALETLRSKRQMVGSDSQSIEASVLDKMWEDLYRQALASELNLAAGPRVRLLKMAGDGDRPTNATATRRYDRAATPPPAKSNPRSSFSGFLGKSR